MNTKKLARLIGVPPQEADEWAGQSQPFRQRILEEAAQPFNTEAFHSLVQELSPVEKRNMARQLELPLTASPRRAFPDAVFYKLLLSKLRQTSGKQKLLTAILLTVMDLYEEAGDYVEEFLEAQEAKIKQYGHWHYYWALRLHPERTEETEERLQQLAAVKEVQAGRTEPAPQPDTANDEACRSFIDPGKHAAVERRLKRESDLRLKAEQESDHLRKQLRVKERWAERLSEEKQKLSAEASASQEEVLRLQALLAEQRLRNEVLGSEKMELLSRLRALESSLAGYQESAAAAERELKQAKHRLLEFKQRSADPRELAERLASGLTQEAEQWCRRLGQPLPDRSSGAAIRGHIRFLFDMVDSLERYLHEKGPISAQSVVMNPQKEAVPTAVYSPASEEEKEEALSLEESAPSREETAAWFGGTFYRRDHGGYIVLEHGEVFNITESMVHHYRLEHEAEVRCRPYEQESGVIHYEIELLLQGDDTYAPINQFSGYVELGEHFTFYCVDMNNPENRYPIHYRDVEVQGPSDGDPCLFNVAVDGHYARLSKLYRKSSQGDEGIKKKLDRQKQASWTAKTDKSKPEPFLTGCKIVIIGGQAKWFESVVSETGAELVHDNGDSPERIHADLRRAQALFMLITATSHRATWSCVEIAKQCRIPHYIIQGSKSNLRTLLWENKEAIQRTATAAHS